MDNKNESYSSTAPTKLKYYFQKSNFCKKRYHLKKYVLNKSGLLPNCVLYALYLSDWAHVDTFLLWGNIFVLSSITIKNERLYHFLSSYIMDFDSVKSVRLEKIIWIEW